MMIVGEDVTNYEALQKSGTETYLTLLEAKVRQTLALQPKKADPKQVTGKGQTKGNSNH